MPAPIERPLGEQVSWSPVTAPTPGPLRGSHVLLRSVDAAGDAESLYAATHPPEGDPAIWTYLMDGPYAGEKELQAMLAEAADSAERVFFAIVPLPGERPLGLASYLQIRPEYGVIEIGNLVFGTPLQRTTAATEAIYLLARHAFDDLGYRRLEWKCNALNAASRAAAERFGFTFEGIFRNHQVVKGRNRDTAWLSITNSEWPAIRAGFEEWLAAGNFDERGHQLDPLGELIARARRRLVAGGS